MVISEENTLASINKLRLLAFELVEKAESLRKDSKDFSTIDEKTEAMKQILQWTNEAESLNVRASELAMQLVENTKNPVSIKRAVF